MLLRILSFISLLFIFVDINVAIQRTNNAVETNDTINALAAVYANLTSAQQRKLNEIAEQSRNGTDQSIKGKINSFVDGVSNSVQSKIDDVKTGVSTQIDNIKNKTSEAIDSVHGTITDASQKVQNEFNSIKNKIQGIADSPTTVAPPPVPVNNAVPPPASSSNTEPAVSRAPPNPVSKPANAVQAQAVTKIAVESDPNVSKTPYPLVNG